MQRDKNWMNVVLRYYSLAGSILLLLFLPGFFYKIGTERVSPVQIGSIPRPDGSMDGRVLADKRMGRFSEISMDGGPFVPAGGMAVARVGPYLPPGTPISFREVTGPGKTATIDGAIQERERPPNRIAVLLLLGLLAVSFSLFGAALAIGGVNRQALSAAALLSGGGLLLGAQFLEPNASLVADPFWRNGVVLLWVVFPRHLTFFWFVSFASRFPLDVSQGRISRFFHPTIAALALLQTVVVTISQFPGTFERLPVQTQASMLAIDRWVTLIIFFLGFAASLGLAVVQVREYRRQQIAAETRRRADVVGTAFLLGTVPPLFLAMVQTIFLVIRGRQLLPPLAMSLSFLPMLLIPLGLSYAFLAPRVESVGILVKKAALFGFAEKTVRVVAILPLAGLAFYLWMHRQSRLDELIAAHPVLLVSAVGASILGLTTADRARGAVERLFFRGKGDAARTLRELAEKARETRDVAALADLLTSESDRALGLESAALFVREPGSGSYSCEGKSLPSLEAASAIAEEALRSKGPLEVAPDDPGSPLHGLPELDRNWLEATRARLLVPLTGSGGDLLAILVLGDKRSELPFDREDEQLLAAAAASAGLALENQILRSSGASEGGRVSAEATADYEPAEPKSEAGLSCRKCGRLFAPGSGALCPDDEAPLEPAPVPHLLAGKYRFEKRIGAGGMGVVYRARDVSLSRDVAIKVLPRVSHDASRRLRREARAAARLIHPNLGLIFAAESWRGTPMLVLEFLDGGTLQERIGCGEIPVADVVGWGIQLAGALEAAHSQGLLHRDIKPSNIGFTSRGVPKLLDFGLVRLLDETAADDAAGPGVAGPFDPLDSAASGLFHLTASGRVAGTPPYLSPEAVQGEPPSAGFDVWGLTITLYEALTGENPFAMAPAERAMNLILTCPLPDPGLVRPDCPKAVAEFFLRALSKSPWERPSSARELRRRLELLYR
jgi:hypothetical protein